MLSSWKTGEGIVTLEQTSGRRSDEAWQAVRYHSDGDRRVFSTGSYTHCLFALLDWMEEHINSLIEYFDE